MKFEDIKTPVISADGKWVAYGIWPEIGDGETLIRSVSGDREFRVERGTNPRLTPDGRWAGVLVQPPYIEAQNAGKEAPRRSEEHTSELQSRGHLVCCLLLAKKKIS